MSFLRYGINRLWQAPSLPLPYVRDETPEFLLLHGSEDHYYWINSISTIPLRSPYKYELKLSVPCNHANVNYVKKNVTIRVIINMITFN